MTQSLQRPHCIALMVLGVITHGAPAMAGNAAALPTTASPGVAATVRPVGLVINGREARDPVLIAEAQPDLLVRSADLGRVLPLPQAAGVPLRINGDDYLSLSAVAGIAARLSDDGTMLVIDADVSVFPTAHITPRPRSLALGDIVPAAFVSYDLVVSRWGGRTSASAFIDSGLSGRWGLLGTTALVQAGRPESVRLDSFYQRDLPAHRVRLVAGDTATRAGEWNAPVRFAGLRIGSDFSLEPHDITFPIPTLAGAAVEPSTIELLSAGTRSSFEVQPGAFLIDYQPAFSGAGDVTLQITDSAGNSRQVTRSFYSSPRLLRPGLADFSIEAGFLRRNYAVRSFDYGDPFGAAFARVGLSDTLTVSGRVEVSPSVQMTGAGLGWVLSPVGEFSLAGAISSAGHGRGTFARVQFQRLARTHSVTLSYQRDNGEFASVGQQLADRFRLSRARRELAVAGTLSLGTLGNLNIGHIDARFTDGERFRSTSIGFAGNLRGAFIDLGYRRTQSHGGIDQGAFVSASVRLGRRAHASLRFDDDRLVAIARRDVPNDEGVGVQVAASMGAHGKGSGFSATGLYRSRVGDVEVSGDWTDGGSGARINARGALVAVAGRIVATPRIDNAFAIVEVESETPVPLYLENRPVAAQGSSGNLAIIASLQPYTENRISIDVSALPIDADINGAERLVVPGYRQAVKARFGGQRGTSATLGFVDIDGSPIPPGLDVFVRSRFVGLTGYDGLVFFETLDHGADVTISGRQYACSAQLPEVTAIDLRGPLVCVSPVDRGFAL